MPPRCLTTPDARARRKSLLDLSGLATALGDAVRGSEHVSVALLTTGGALWLINGELELSAAAIAAGTAAAIGSLVPDIDHPRAWISNRIPASLLAFGVMVLGGFWLTTWMIGRDPSQMFAPVFTGLLDIVRPYLSWAWLSVTVGILLLMISLLVAQLVEHRGPTHSMTVGLVLTLAVTTAFAIVGRPAIGLWFGWGYLTHLLTDAMTPMGCPSLLWPWRAGDLVGLKLPAPSPKTTPHPTANSAVSQDTSTTAHPDPASPVAVENLDADVLQGRLIEPEPSDAR